MPKLMVCSGLDLSVENSRPPWPMRILLIVVPGLLGFVEGSVRVLQVLVEGFIICKQGWCSLRVLPVCKQGCIVGKHRQVISASDA